jgi:tetratricopeptide (TPR) repeat protein
MRKVIIGAGPAGLYTAIKLRKAGIYDVTVYDPRAGKYTRPGHLNRNVFATAQEGLGIEFWPEDTIGHIKDLERALYKEAKRLGIKIENKRFVRLQADPKKPGVVVDGEGGEETVEADYVFDCTGTRREVVAAVNKVVPDSPLKLTTITELPVRNHFLAYVKVSKREWARFEENNSRIRNFPETIDALDFAQSIIKLRALGWNEFKFPRCYGMEFGKDKVCMYLHAPDNLSKKDYDSWVQTVLECYTKPIHYEHLPPSPKPRFLPFRASAQALQEVSYKGKNLPTVITLGDAQIDFDYYLAHGIRDGMERIDALFDHIEAFDNHIHYFDSTEYLQTINRLLSRHKEAVINEADKMRKSFVDALDAAQLKFRQALLLSKDDQEKRVISDTLKEIEVRQAYAKARQMFVKCHNKSNQVVVTPVSIDGVIVKLNQIHTDLLKAYSGLPASFVTEKKDVQDLLTYLAVSWKEVGNALFKAHKLPEAIDAYKKALDVYNLDGFIAKHILKELSIYSNLAIVYLQSKLYSDAIAAAKAALSIFDSCEAEDQPAALREKIVFNLIKALCAQAEDFLLSQKINEANLLHLKAKNIMNTHESKLTKQTLRSIQDIINELQKHLPAKEGSDVSNRSEVSEVWRHSKGGESAEASDKIEEEQLEKRPVSQSLKTFGFFPLKDVGVDPHVKQYTSRVLLF